MQCRIHPEENGVNTCNQCGSWICEKCTFEINGRLFCPHCAAQQSERAATYLRSPVKERARDVGYTAVRPRKQLSWGLLFLFSVIIPWPGLNYMYLGLIKRGLSAMSVFFGVSYLGTLFVNGSTWQLGMLCFLVIPILWASCVFDGFKLRNQLNAGEVVKDDIEDIVGFFRKYRVFFAFIILIAVFAQVFSWLWPWAASLTRNILPILLVLWAVKVLFKK